MPSALCAGESQPLSPEELIAQGRYREAVPLLEAQRASMAKDGVHLALVVTLNNLGSAYYELSRYRDAQRVYEESLLLRRRLNDAASRDAARTLSNLGVVYLELRLIAKARDTLQQAARALELQDPDGLPITGVWLNLATAYKAERRVEDAEALFRRGLAARERILGPAHRDVAMALNNLGVLLRDRNQLVDAQPLLERAVAIWERTLGLEHPQVHERILVARREHRHALGLAEPRHVVEVAVLAIRIVDVAGADLLGCRGHQHDAVAHGRHDPCPAVGERTTIVCRKRHGEAL